jgi:hypothetical protein
MQTKLQPEYLHQGPTSETKRNTKLSVNDEKDRLNRECKKLRIFTLSQGGNKYPAYSTEQER